MFKNVIILIVTNIQYKVSTICFYTDTGPQHISDLLHCILPPENFLFQYMHSQNCMPRDQNSWSTSILLCQTSCSEQSLTHALSVWFTHQLLCTLLVWMFFVVLLPCESTCMHCVCLALWTQVFVWVFMCHICIFIHSFHRLPWSRDLGFVLQAKTHCLYY